MKQRMYRQLTVAAGGAAGFLLPIAAQGAVACGGPNADGAMACTIDPVLDVAALCNDGTLPVFWIRPGSGRGMHHWVIWLEGGGQCTDRTSCAARAQGSGAQFVTANGFGAGTGQGVLASDPATNPAMYDANTVLVHYCSSDLWSGNDPATARFDPNDPGTWHFQGRRIAKAAIASLGELGLDLAHAEQIVLGGSSAGGVGIAVTANDILPVLPDAPDIRLIDDAGFALNIGQYDPALSAPYVHPMQGDAFEALFLAGMALWNGRGDAVCDAAAPNQTARVACYTSAIFQRHLVPLPSFVAQSQLDLAQISDELCPLQYGNCPVPHDPQSMQGLYATAFGARMALTLIGGAGAAWSVFAPDAYQHVMMTNASAFTTRYPFASGGLTPREVVEAWLLDGNATRVVDMGNQPGVDASHRRKYAGPR